MSARVARLRTRLVAERREDDDGSARPRHAGTRAGMLPPEAFHLYRLQVLDLHDNQLEGGLHMNIASMSGLTHLDLRDNQLEGRLPSTLSYLIRLETLLLNGNALEALPDDELQSYTDIQRFLYCVGCNEKEPPVAVAHAMRGDEVAI